jgi:phosphoribosylaminoimidazole-succinocarboxamide synthase
MTPEIVNSISERYIELYEHIVGETFIKADADAISSRIESNVVKALETL